MALNVNLKKKLQFRLEKLDLVDITCRVGFACDVSGSMRHLYTNGDMSSLNERLLVIGNRFDDNGEMDMKMFDNSCHDLPGMTEENYQGYIQDYILDSRKSIWGGTYYSHPIMDFAKDWFPKKGLFSKFKKDKDLPSFLILQTDGENHDPVQTEQAIKDIQSKEMYLTFLGIGRSSFPFIERMAEKYPNVGFLHSGTINSLSDDEIYEQLITEELATWLKNAVK